jgi:hypothetical protein
VFNLLPACENGRPAPEVDIRRNEIAGALVVAPVVVEDDEFCELRLELTRQGIVPKQDPVLQRAMVMLDLPLDHWTIWQGARVAHAVLVEPSAELG